MQSEKTDESETIDYATYYADVNDLSEHNYQTTSKWYASLLADIICEIPKDARILDAGCGAGLLVHALLSYGFRRVVGIEPSETLVAIALAKGLPVRQVPTNYIESTLPANGEQYDVVFLMDVLEHIPTPRQLPFLQGLRTALSEHGRVILSVPNACSTLAGYWRYNDWTHTTSFTTHSLRFILHGAGFKDVRFLASEGKSRPRLPLIPRKSVFYWLLRSFARAMRRLEVVGELGSIGWTVPITLNLLAVAKIESRPTASPGRFGPSHL